MADLMGVSRYLAAQAPLWRNTRGEPARTIWQAVLAMSVQMDELLGYDLPHVSRSRKRRRLGEVYARNGFQKRAKEPHGRGCFVTFTTTAR